MPNDASNSVSIVLGFDYGTKRIGVAVGNSLTGSSQALDAIQNRNPDQTHQKIKELIAQKINPIPTEIKEPIVEENNVQTETDEV